MALYYLPSLVRSDRYFLLPSWNRIQSPATGNKPNSTSWIYADDRVLAPLLPWKTLTGSCSTRWRLPDQRDIPLRECQLSMVKREGGYELLIPPQQELG